MAIKIEWSATDRRWDDQEVEAILRTPKQGDEAGSLVGGILEVGSTEIRLHGKDLRELAEVATALADSMGDPT